jgi:Cytochrome c7 and related cytochrome c
LLGQQRFLPPQTAWANKIVQGGPQRRWRDTLRKYRLTYLLLVGLAASLVVLVFNLRSYPFPGNQEGYSPEQPIAFSHKLHAGELEMSCLYCHAGASKSAHAGIPAASLCMNCHRLVTASWEVTKTEMENARQADRPPQHMISPELKKLYEALDLKNPTQQEVGKDTKPIQWVKVHNLPAYTRFDHRAHVQAGVACQQCHGPVETMDVIRQSADLSMGWCVQCHKGQHKDIGGRKVSPSTDCATCHY